MTERKTDDGRAVRSDQRREGQADRGENDSGAEDRAAEPCRRASTATQRLGTAQISEICDDRRRRHKGWKRRSLGHGAVEPGDVPLVVRREFGAVVVVMREVLMDGGVWMMRVGIVPMLLRQRGGEGEARHQRQAHDRHAQVPQHSAIMVRCFTERQTGCALEFRPTWHTLSVRSPMRLATLVMFLLSAATAATQTAVAPAVVFVCEHGAAKSVIATAYFNKLAARARSSIPRDFPRHGPAGRVVGVRAQRLA